MSRLRIRTETDLTEAELASMDSITNEGLYKCMVRLAERHDMDNMSAGLHMLSRMVNALQRIDAAACGTLLSAMDRIGRASLEGRTDAGAQRDYATAHTALLEAADLTRQPSAGRG